MKQRSAIPLLAVIAMAIWTGDSSAQVEHEGEIEGFVRSADSADPLAGALVSVMGTGRTAVTHGDGSFHIAVPGTRSYTVQVERLGYRTVSVEVDAPGEEVLVVEMEADPLSLPGVVVTGSAVARSANETLRPTSVFAGEDLQRRLSGTVAETLASEPGLTVSNMGPGAAHPVIRGLSGDRILMLEDGERVGDVFSTGADHATALDPSAARRIEVIRGAGSILYGSNALGGVINVVRDEVPSSVPHHFTGAFTAQGQSVNEAASASLNASYALTGHIPLRIEVSRRTSNDLKTPVGTLLNTDTDLWELSGGTSWVDDWGHAGAAFRYYRNDYGIPGGFVGGHTAGVRIEMERSATRTRSLLLDQGIFETIEIDAGHTWYRHKEIEPPDILGTLFERQTVTGEVLGRHGGLGPFSSGAVGMRASWESFGFGGGLYTPDSRRADIAAYLLEEIDLDPIRLEVGLRYDHVEAWPLEEDPDSNIGHVRARTFGAASGSLGALARISENVIVGASFARAFRTPSINELYSEGPHLAAYAFEVGNPSLETENGTGTDVFIRFLGTRVSGEATLFRNAISGYVFPLETGELSRVRLPIFQFHGEDAVLSGFEGALEFVVVGDLKVEAVGSHVKGVMQDTNEPLPLIPPLQGRFAIGYAPRAWFAEAEARVAAQQDRTGPFESPTEGYAVFDLSAGIRITVGGRLNVITVRGENLGNTEYRNHLSRVKEIMPEPGRSVSVSYRVVF